MARKLLSLISIIIIISLLPGCWSRREIEDLAIITILGIDRVKQKGSDKYMISVQVIRPAQLGGGERPSGGGAGGGKAPTRLAVSYGDTIFDAARNFSLRSPRTMVLYHDKLFIIGEPTARQGVADILDFLSRHKDIRRRSWIIISRGEALSALQAAPETEKLLSDEIGEMLSKTASQASKSYGVDLREFTAALVTPGIDAVATALQVLAPPEPGGTDSPISQGEPSKTVKNGGLAVFRRDRLAGWLDENETKGFLFIKGRAQSGTIPLKDRERKLSFLMTRADSKIIPRINGNKVSYTIKIRAEGDIAEDDAQKPVATPEELAGVNREATRAIRELAQSALRKAQKEYKADIFGFGDKLHKTKPGYWHKVENKWDEMYPNVEARIEVAVKIRRTGMIGEPHQIK